MGDYNGRLTENLGRGRAGQETNDCMVQAGCAVALHDGIAGAPRRDKRQSR